MPFVPIPYLTPVGAAPSAPGGTVQAPTVNVSGVQSAAAKLGQASELSSIPKSAFLAPGQGLAAIGDGVADVAALIREKQEIFEKTDTDNGIAKWQGALAVSKAKWNAERRGKLDPGEWKGDFEQFANQAVTEMLNDSTLTRDARQILTNYGNKWRDSNVADIINESYVEKGERTQNEVIANVQRSIDLNDIDGADRQVRIIEDAVARKEMPYMSPRVIDGLRDAVRKGREKAELDLQYDAIRQNPRQWMDIYKTRPEGMPAPTYERLVNFAQQTDREQVATDANALANAIALGQTDALNPNAITVPEQVDLWQQDNPRITPAMRQEARSSVIRRNDAIARQNIIAHAPEIASRLRTEVANFDWKRDGELKYYKLRMRIDELPAPISGEVSKDLEMKFPGRAANLDAPKEVKDMVESTLTSMFNSGIFGAFDYGTGKNAKGEPVAVPGESPDEDYKRNPRDYERALRVKAEVGGKMWRWLNGNPGVTPEKAQEELYKFAPDATRAKLIDAFDTPGALDGPKIDPAGIMNDMPDTPAGQPDNSLIPFTIPQ